MRNFVSAVLLCIIPSLLNGEESIRPTLRVPISDAPPFLIITDKAEKGINYDIQNYIANQMAWDIKTIECPFKRCVSMLRRGEIDMMGLLYRTPEREKYLYYIDPPYHTEHITFYFLAGKGKELQSYEDLSKFRIGTITGVKYFQRFDIDNHLRKFPVTTEKQRFKMLMTGRIDTLPIDYINYITLVDELGMGNIFSAAPYNPSGNDDYLTLSKNSPLAHHRQSVSKIVRKMIKSGVMARIFQRYKIKYSAPTTSPGKKPVTK